MFTVFVIIITHSLYSIDVSCGYPNSVYGNLAPLNRLVNEANKSVNFALAEQTCCLTSTLCILTLSSTVRCTQLNCCGPFCHSYSIVE